MCLLPANSPNGESFHDKERLSHTELSLDRRRLSRHIKPRASSIFLFLLDILVIWLLIHNLEPLITLLRRNDELFRPQVNFFEQEDRTNGSSYIPRILHQTAPTDIIPDKWTASQESCQRSYQDFEYKLWTDESTRAFLSIHYPWFVDVWDNYPFPIQRADSLRYFVLYHYGGIYLDMDTWCNNSVPIDKIESDAVTEYALFKSTTPTGITNDFMITSAKHPIYAAAIAKLPAYNDFSRTWARWQPYCAIMISAGPMFLTMVVKDYLLQQTSLSFRNLGVVNQTELSPYLTDLESGSWHTADTNILMWLGTRPWAWFSLGAVGLCICLYLMNRAVMIMLKVSIRKIPRGW
ncbi:hypothetical protein N7520_008358 [Penicillium odoratum]|uniref:uncharacterized protein n=1 Tax=Penicillium odoratum TaxID=1167516 RepID=UPI002549A47D|nr:uncharacterized protein N7520_008358 [Penicillium odoratum]KAJ5761202.1 hypothetical protein N7520_008358 [Penicillium odoratum]